MKLKIIISILIVVFVVSGLAFLASKSSVPNRSTSTTNNNNINNSNSNNSSNNNSNNNNTPAGPSGSSNASLLFSNQPYAPYSYLIYPGTPSSQAQAALSGFSISTTQLQNGSAMITLALVSTSGNQTVTLKPGFKLYFVETSFSDDSFGGESSLGDDGYVTVDPNGYVA